MGRAPQALIGYAGPMFAGWENYYLLIGSAAAALIGLMFVVVTLTAGRDRQEVERGKQLYTSPIVWHLAVVLVLSGAATAPILTSRLFALASAALALLGFVYCLRSAIGICRAQVTPGAVGFDMIWYGIAPAAVYVGLGAAAISILDGATWGASVIAVDLMALLLVSIHAEWDLVTYLAPMAEASVKTPSQPGATRAD